MRRRRRSCQNTHNNKIDQVKVYLVGAGPGAYDLITVRGLELLKNADVVMNDRLVSPKLLECCKPGCRILNVGKSSEKERFAQKDLEKELIAEAKLLEDGKYIVRLKGGDPYIYGLGGSEGLVLDEAGIQWEYVPGLSSSTSLPGLCLRAPLTHKGSSSGFMVMSGHVPPAHNSEWGQLPRCTEPLFTLVVIMCAKNLQSITSFLRIDLGWSPNLPSAVIQSGSTAEERTLRSTLDSIADDAEAHKIDEAPLALVIGKTLNVFQPRFTSTKAQLRFPQVWGNAREVSGGDSREWWVFGYGSLIWKSSTDVPHLHVEDGYITGFVRRFWQSSPDHRGTEEKPGRVVTILPLEVAKSVTRVEKIQPEKVFGRVFKVDPNKIQETREKLFHREKAGYEERAVDVTTKDGRKIKASTFIALPENEHFAGEEPVADIAKVIFESVGPSGLNLEYFDELFTALTEMQLRWGERNDRVVDAHIIDLAQALAKLKNSK